MENDAQRPRLFSPRRLPFWLVVVGMGLVVSFFIIRASAQRERVQAVLRISRQGSPNGTDFDLYKRTQSALIKGHLVLQSALRKPEVARLPLIKQQKDPVAWLANELVVYYPGDSEILSVGMMGHDEWQLAKIVNAVTESYMDEIVNAEQQDRMRNKQILEKKIRDQEEELQRLGAALEKAAPVPAEDPLAQKVAAHKLESRLARRDRFERRIDEIDLRLTRLESSDESDEKKATRGKSLRAERRVVEERLAALDNELAAQAEQTERQALAVAEAYTKIKAQRDELDQLRAITASMKRDAKLFDVSAQAWPRVVVVEEASGGE